MFLFYRIYLSICAFSPSSPSTWSGPCLNRVLIFSWFCSQWEINFSWFLWAPWSLINLETYVEDGKLYRDFLTDMNEMNAQDLEWQRCLKPSMMITPNRKVRQILIERICYWKSRVHHNHITSELENSKSKSRAVMNTRGEEVKENVMRLLMLDRGWLWLKCRHRTFLHRLIIDVLFGFSNTRVFGIELEIIRNSVMVDVGFIDCVCRL